MRGGIFKQTAVTLREARHSLLLAAAVFALGCALGVIFQDHFGFLQEFVSFVLPLLLLAAVVEGRYHIARALLG